MIKTTIALVKLGYLNKDEIKDCLNLYEQHLEMFQTKTVQINDPLKMKELIREMRAANKVMSPWFIRDWCLKCFKYLHHTSILVFNNTLAIGKSPSKT